MLVTPARTFVKILAGVMLIFLLTDLWEIGHFKIKQTLHTNIHRNLGNLGNLGMKILDGDTMEQRTGTS